MRFTAVRLALLALLVAAAGASLFLLRDGGNEVAQSCPPGYVTAHERERMERREQLAQGARGEAEREREAEDERRCFTRKHPEPKGELMTRDRQASARVTAPASRLKPGAYAAAARACGASLPGRDGRAGPTATR